MTVKAPPLTKVARKTSAKIIPKQFKVVPLDMHPQTAISKEDQQVFVVAKLAEEHRIHPLIQELRASNPSLSTHLDQRIRWLKLNIDFRILFVLMYIVKSERDVALYCHALKKFSMDEPDVKQITFLHFQQMFSNGFPSAQTRHTAWKEQIAPDGTMGVDDPQYW